MRISPPAPAWIPLLDCLIHVTKTGVLPNSRCTAPIFRAKSSCEKPQRLRETRLSLPRSQAKVKLRKSLLRLYLALRRSRNAQVSPTVVHSRPGYDLLHLLYDPGRSFADGTILRTRREVGRLTKE